MGRLVMFILCCYLQAIANAQEHKPFYIPDHAKAQFAGGIGFVSVGVGFSNKKEKLEGDFYYGYVPESVGGDHLHAISSKLTWFPVNAIHHKSLQLKPLSLGVLLNYTFGKEYFLFAPENYPYEYYGHPTALHAGFFMGGQANLQVNKRLKKIGVYYELGTTDVELASFLGNRRSLKPGDIFNLGIGVKAGL